MLTNTKRNSYYNRLNTVTEADKVQSNIYNNVNKADSLTHQKI